jgi:hypothetical protein
VLGISLHRFSIRPHFNYAVKGLIAKYSRIVFNAQDDGANGEAAVLPVPHSCLLIRYYGGQFQNLLPPIPARLWRG